MRTMKQKLLALFIGLALGNAIGILLSGHRLALLGVVAGTLAFVVNLLPEA